MIRCLLAALLCLSSLSAQFIGTRYGTGTPDYMNNCSQFIWHAQNIYAYGSASIGQNFVYMTVRRDWCPTDQAFFHILTIGSSIAATPLPASLTNTHDSFLHTSADVVVFGALDQTNVQYVYPQHIPLNGSLIGANVYSQWVLYWIDVNSQYHIMLSDGLVVQVEP